MSLKKELICLLALSYSLIISPFLSWSCVISCSALFLASFCIFEYEMRKSLMLSQLQKDKKDHYQ